MIKNTNWIILSLCFLFSTLQSCTLGNNDRDFFGIPKDELYGFIDSLNEEVNNQRTVIIICILSVCCFLIFMIYDKIKRLNSSKKYYNTPIIKIPSESSIQDSSKTKIEDSQNDDDTINESPDSNVCPDSSTKINNGDNIKTKATTESSVPKSKPEEKNIKAPDIIERKQSKTLDVKPDNSEVDQNTVTKQNYILRVNYIIKKNYTSNDYVQISFPKLNCIVFPFRTHLISRRGYCEQAFENLLIRYKANKVHIIGNANIALGNGARPYEPDIAVICDGKQNIRIDIEIDEPYSGLTHEPIHYIGCGDEFRDLNLTNAGWIVIRFAEKQIIEQPLSCIAYIYWIINILDASILIPDKLKSISLPSSIAKWTELEAKLMAAKNEREKYLNHNFGIDDSQEYNPKDITQTQQEKELSGLLDKLPGLEEYKARNLDNSINYYSQDKEIKFFAKEHIYVYHDYLQLTPVSDIIGKFFRKFNDLKWSEIKARQNNVSQRYMLELWDCKGAESREVGTFLHSQIESHFNRKDIFDTYHFKYDGVEIKKDECVSIKKEWSQFICFINENHITPFRTEWRIFDLQFKIAGTIDLLCKNNGKYDIYDWKRSDKIDPYQKIWQYGINGLENVPDTRFYHYCLQQNLYRYMLEKNYHIEINKMHLVILHPLYLTYRLIQVPRMDREIKTILTMINKI